MMDKYKINLSEVRISERVTAILGLPKEILTEEIISSPIFIEQAENYINKISITFNMYMITLII